MQIKVAPTRMELLRLKKRIDLAHRGIACCRTSWKD